MDPFHFEMFVRDELIEELQIHDGSRNEVGNMLLYEATLQKYNFGFWSHFSRVSWEKHHYI